DPLGRPGPSSGAGVGGGRDAGVVRAFAGQGPARVDPHLVDVEQAGGAGRGPLVEELDVEDGGVVARDEVVDPVGAGVALGEDAGLADVVGAVDGDLVVADVLAGPPDPV